MHLVEAADRLSNLLRPLRFGRPVAHVYNPLEYAARPHHAYLQKYGTGRKKVLLVGMNPGPWGMVQTGVPFGEVGAVRDFLKIHEPVDRPAREHPARPVLGFDCRRREVSGMRLWGWVQRRFGTPKRFFRDFFVLNYCPLAFMDDGGRNLTPDKLPIAQRRRVEALCDESLATVVDLLAPRYVVGIGAFAEKRIRTALEGRELIIGHILHPSPASPAANRDWIGQAERGLTSLGIVLPESADDASPAKPATARIG
jgi:single-strand selective monofunctional uracil DNA glycosylase